MNSPLQPSKILLNSALLAGLLSANANALDIMLTDGSAVPMTANQFAAAEAAAEIWEDRFDDPILVNIIIAFDSLPPNVLGSTLIARTTHAYSSVRAAMVTDATPGDELNAVVQLDALSLPLIDINGFRNATQVTLTTANAKALGLGTGLDPIYPNPPIGIDAQITFDIGLIAGFDFDPSDGITPGLVDFVGTATHEIGHALGYASQVEMLDLNPGFTLAPAGLDIWRFPESAAAHAIASDARFVTAGDAEWYDSVLNNVTLSHGDTTIDPLCNSTTGQCQASHWSDDQGNLMDPTMGASILSRPGTDDYHGLDYIGYDANLVMVRLDNFNDVHVVWYDGLDFVPAYAPYPLPPHPVGTLPPWANLGLAVFFDLDELGLRSASGYARFEQEAPISPEMVQPAPFPVDHTNLNPPGPPNMVSPAALVRMTLNSEDVNGVPFRFRATCAETGCQYDPTLGEHGGYRVPGQLDGSADLKVDIDGRVMLVLLADETGQPDPQARNVFTVDVESPETTMQLFDRQAFGLDPLPDGDTDGVPDEFDNCSALANAAQRDTDNDGYGNACDGDIAEPNDCFVTFADLIVEKQAFQSSPGDPRWNPNADLNGDNAISFADIIRFKQLFAGSPGPSGLVDSCGL